MGYSFNWCLIKSNIHLSATISQISREHQPFCFLLSLTVILRSAAFCYLFLSDKYFDEKATCHDRTGNEVAENMLILIPLFFQGNYESSVNKSKNLNSAEPR